MSIRQSALTAATALVFAVGVLAPAMPASAEPRTASPAALELSESALSARAPAGAELHCALDIGSAEAPRAKVPEPVCFSSVDEVDRYLEERSAAVGSRSLAAGSVAAASVAVGRIYKDINKGGSSLTFWGSSGCDGATFGFPSLSSSWNTSVSSIIGLNGCWATGYLATSYGGSRMNCMPYCSALGSYNDRIKSLVFRPKGTLG
ncbi:hypothetical protein [Agromyces italicus]|uniref:hypothetical protein n=1 Tax=Agromyces italicus TaxID=279572 RepID=UPI0012F73D5D|nr:hypothetical protein [Agromyces italicus]